MKRLLSRLDQFWKRLKAGLGALITSQGEAKPTVEATPSGVDAIPPEVQQADIYIEGESFCGPNGQPFAKVKPPGLVNYGATTADEFIRGNPDDFANVPASVLRVMQAVSANEGKLEAVNTYDGSFLSFGVFQWTAGAFDYVGELAGFLDRLRGTNPEAFQKYFAAYGLNVEMEPPAQGRLRKGYIVLDNRRLDTPESKEVLRQPIWAYRFWRAAHDPDVRRTQVMLAMERIGLFYQVPQPALEGRPICDFITSEYGVALLLDQHVNRPGHVITTLVEALKLFKKQTGKGNPAEWTTDDEGAYIACYLECRAKTNMTDPQERADRLMQDQRLSKERKSFVA